jgi:hypothetical protein
MSVSSQSQDGADADVEAATPRHEDACTASSAGVPDSQTARRVLFLDDDPRRATRFLKQVPAAVWVQSVAECLPRMLEAWDEIHLDHDLGGEILVDTNRADSGMEVIRWLCKEPRPHLRETRFFVHTHNFVAGLLMVLQMRESGYEAELRPFGYDLATALENPPSEILGPTPRAAAPARGWRRFLRWALAHLGPPRKRS